MRKLLILILVLGMTSAAWAVPVISGPSTIPQGGSITLTVSGTAAEASTDSVDSSGGYAGWIWVDYPYTYQFSNVSSGTTAMGSMAAFDLTTYLPSGGGFKFTAAPGIPWAESTDVDAGTWFTFTFSDLAGSTVGDTYDVQILDTAFNIISAATFTVTVVPEPVTIALLGFGGLLLRRRK